MTFQFLLQSTPIEHNEAMALMEVAHPERRKPFEIDLAKVINVSTIDSKKLFDMAVKHENPTLASLAFKMSVTHKGGDATEKAAVRAVRAPRMKAPEPTVETGVEELIETLCSANGYWATGAALLITSVRNDEWTTLKDIAVKYANSCWETTDITSASVLFKGFREVSKAGTYSWEPLELQPGVERKHTFHVSPIYIGLREGLKWCGKHNLVEQKSGISVGSSRSNTSGRAESMQRVYYKIRATEKGEMMKEMWADIDSYLLNFFKSRMA